MRKLGALLLSSAILSAFVVFVSSCDDDAPPVPPQLSFAVTTLTAKESDENILIEVVLDKPAAESITIDYSLGGTALDEVAAGTTADPDYEIVGDHGEVEIDKGETVGTIEINLYSDGNLESDETIEISIEEVDSDDIEITRDDEINITVQQEDGLVVVLEWPAPSANGQADMDLLLRVGQTTATWDGVLLGSAQGSVEGPEVLFVPKALTYPAYGLSYTYYDGTLDPLIFKTTFIDFTNGQAEAAGTRESFDVTYTAVNKNKWTDLSTTIVVQTFLKTGGAFASPSAVTVPVAGSRIGSNDNFVTLVKKNSSRADWFNQFQTLYKK